MRFLPTVFLVATACAGEGDERPASWSYIHAAIIAPRCATASCHSDLGRAKTLSFSDRDEAFEYIKDDDNYFTLTDLLKGVRVDLPRMPPDQPLPAADIVLIERWNAEGRQDN